MRNLSKTGWVAAVVTAVAAAGFSANAVAQAYPARPITAVVPVAAGGGSEFLIRLVATALGERLGQPVILEFRPSSDAGIGFAYAAKAAPDGYTLVVVINSLPFNVALDPNVPYKMSDFVPISQLANNYFVFAANPSFPANSLADLIRIAKANPGSVKFAQTGPSLLILYLGFASRAGFSTLNVPFKGSGDARPSVLNGTVDFVLETPAGPLSLVQSGRMKVIGVTGPTRMSLFPNAQAISEVLPGFEIKNWFGLSGPAGMPRDRIDRISREIAAIMKTPEIQKKLEAVYFEPVGSTPEVFGAQLNADFEFFKKEIKETGYKKE